MSTSRLTTKPDFRDEHATTVLLDALPPLPLDASVLVIGDRLGQVAPDLTNRKLSVTTWNRIAHRAQSAQPWPAAGPFDAATLRLPRGKTSLELSLHAIASVLKPGAPLWVYGANDEGIKSVRTRLKPLMGEVTTLDARKHCRVVEAHRPAEIPGLHPTLEDFRQEMALPLPEGEVTHITYPGIFAKGKLDDGTFALLNVLPPIKEKARVLDFACGAGVIGGVLQRRHPEIELWMTDADAIAVHAAQQNIPNARGICGDAWRGLPAIRHFDYVFSNPPIHTGKGRDYTVLTELIDLAPTRMRIGAELWLVTQRQIPVDGPLEARYNDVQRVHEDSRFWVWRASAPKSDKKR